MKRSRTSSHALALSLKPLFARAGIVLLLSASLGLIVMGRTHSTLPENVRSTISDSVIPVINVLAKPVDAITNVGHWVSDIMVVRQENIKLKSDNARLQQWQSVATELASENDKLRALLRFAPASHEAYTSARVAADSESPYSRSVIITSGSNQGVQEDLAVVNDAGLVGRIVDVGKKTSRVLLLTDINSRIPIISEESRERAIAGGNNGDTMTLLYGPEDSKLKVGEKIVTSGDGGMLAPGLPVGVVTKIEKGVATVKPFVDGYHLEYVSVVDLSM